MYKRQVFQNPDNQIIGSIIEEDVGFGPENIGVPTEEIWERVTKSLKNVGMYEYRTHSPNKLSGGQKQRVAIAGVMALSLIHISILFCNFGCQIDRFSVLIYTGSCKWM